jgi:hypothetical protein
MARTFGFDVLACPPCGGRLRLIALIEEGGRDPEFLLGHDRILCELRDHGPYGVEAQFGQLLARLRSRRAALVLNSRSSCRMGQDDTPNV